LQDRQGQRWLHGRGSRVGEPGRRSVPPARRPEDQAAAKEISGVAFQICASSPSRSGGIFFAPMNPSSPGPARWEKLKHETLAATRVFDLHSTRYRHPTRATERDFIVAHPPDWVNVLALTPDRRLVLVRQFRFGVDGFSLEIPGGVMARDEDPV